MLIEFLMSEAEIHRLSDKCMTFMQILAKFLHRLNMALVSG